jgi:hypothetical protein
VIFLSSTFVGLGRGSLDNNPTNFHFIVWISYFEFAVTDVGATMRPIASNAEFFLALKGLIYSWCDRRALNPLARVLGPYVAFDGLTESWAEILDALKTIRASCRLDISEPEMDTLGELIRMAERGVYRDRNSD